MMFALANLLLVVVLFVTMLAVQQWGRRLGERDRPLEPDKGGPSAAEGAVYGLLGLFLAFTFSGAGARFDERRHLVVDEANAIGTAWRRIDVLPASARPHMRDLFRKYVDARLETYRLVPDWPAVEAATSRTAALQQEIWSSAVDASHASGQTPPFTVLLPAVNEMIDIRTARGAAIRVHPPLTVFVMMTVLALVGSLFAGYGMAGKTRRWIHTLGFAGVMTMALYVIIDLEFPRLGLIRVDAIDAVLLDLRRSMN